MEHKDIPSFAGPPRLQCGRLVLSAGDQRTGKWSPDGCGQRFAAGAVGSPWEGEFPRYVWYMHGNTVFEARLVNRGSGSYKGYPLDRDEWPNGIELLYATA